MILSMFVAGPSSISGISIASFGMQLAKIVESISHFAYYCTSTPGLTVLECMDLKVKKKQPLTDCGTENVYLSQTIHQLS